MPAGQWLWRASWAAKNLPLPRSLSPSCSKALGLIQFLSAVRPRCTASIPTPALDRAAEMIRDLAGGEILRGLIDVYPKPKKRDGITLQRCEILRVLGAEVPEEDVERIMPSLGITVECIGIGEWNVTPPSFRLDVTRQVDLIEEVARHFGYDRLPARLVPAPPHAE